MPHFLYHYLYQDFYIPVWPNIAASAVVGFLVILRIRDHLRKHHERIERLISLHTHVTSTALGGLHEYLSELHSAIRNSSNNGTNDQSLFARSEVESGSHGTNQMATGNITE